MAKLLGPGRDAHNDKTLPSDRTIAVLMSGGVDSSISAVLLREQGYHIVGVTMTVPNVTLPGETDAEAHARGDDAAGVCAALDIPHYFADIRAEFETNVLGPFRDDYRRGRTPSPCVNCNPAIKFGLVRELIERELGVDQIATGHYARIKRDGDAAHLHRPADPQRDQTYFLYRIPRDVLPRLHFPVADFTKDKVREMAALMKLPIADRPDSMELCFAAGGDYRNVLDDEPDGGPGEFVDVEGNVLGRHRGIANYTVGQRRGLGIAVGHPIVVLAIDPDTNRIIVGPHANAYSTVAYARQVNILEPDLLAPGAHLLGMVRSRSAPSPCTVEAAEDDRLAVRFDEPQHAITPGQHLVLYNHDGRVIAGGVIETSDLREKLLAVGC